MINRRKILQLGAAASVSLPFLEANARSLSVAEQKSQAMKTLGMIGGTSWHSTIDYYRYINQMVNDRQGNRVNPPLLITNLNQLLVNTLQAQGMWKELTQIYVDAGKSLVAGGAQSIIFCSNTAHKLYDDVSAALTVPILHIADATGQAAEDRGVRKLALFGTKYTMESPFIQQRLRSTYGMEVFTPNAAARNELARIIAEELSAGRIEDDSRAYLVAEMDKLKKRGAEAIILGCTEFPMLVKQHHYDLPLLDTTYLHAQMAVNFILDTQ